MRVVFDDEQHRIAFLDGVAIVLDVLITHNGQDREHLGAAQLAHGTGGHRGTLVIGPGVEQRQVEGERASLSVGADEFDFATEQNGQLAADGKPKARAAVFAGRSSVGLLESLEDEPLLLRRDADARILDGKSDDLPGAFEYGVILTPAVCGEPDTNFDVALGGELDGVGEQVLENLLEALRIAIHGLREIRVEVHTEWQALRLGHVPEVAFDGFAQTGKTDFLDLDSDGAGLDFGKIENVVDKVQQFGAGGIDVARILDLLVREVAGDVGAELLAENEDGIERRAQLVGHVRQELGLVFRGERQLGGLFLERVAGVFDLRVLALDLGILLGQQPGLGAELLVRLLQFALAGLKLDGELLRLREQAFGTHRRLDGVEDCADTLGQQIEESQ